MKFEIRNLKLGVFTLSFFLLGCTTFQPRPDAFTPLDKLEATKALESISSSSEGLGTAKFKMKFSATAFVDGKKEKYNANARCLWDPQKHKLRIRVYYLAVTLADLLYTGTQWYVTDENGSKVYICKRIDRVRINNVPQDFLRLLEKVPESWIPENKDIVSVAEAENIYKLNWQQKSSEIEMLFPIGSPVPSELIIESEDGTSFSSMISNPNTNFNFSSAMFKPTLEGYEVIKIEN